MKFGRRHAAEPEGIMVAPLIDIVFLTLVFFMTTAVYGTLENEADITLPIAESSAPIERAQGEIVINVKEDGTIVVNDRTMDLAELQGVLERVAEYFPGGAVIIRGDSKAFLGRAIEVLDACRRAGIQNVSFAALPPAAPAGPA